ncbi:Hypothetical predicted protein [Paramuricea clavata]|uniref:Uncharacterized protein n=1 Tax=Paramuricea clavata TaxID=317549 RepID=A0A7D9HTS6_PARCT|nr:Hypothetical predicted protein [Paramuricea clavata]
MTTESELPRRTVRKCYLITYSQADSQKFPTRDSFASAVVQSFSVCETKSKILHWACSRSRAPQRSWFHYHMSIKFDGNRRWLKSKEYLMEYHGIPVYFSDNYNDYYTAYKYITNMYVEALHSESHPDLKSAAAPRTERAKATWCRSSKQKRDDAQTQSANLSCSLASLKQLRSA